MDLFWGFMGWPSSRSTTPDYTHEQMSLPRPIDIPVDRGVEADGPSLLQALVIGIDKYPSEYIPALSGAVADADAMDKYLREDLHVPPKQIVNLRNERATRSAIVQNIKAFARRKGIRKGHPILIYFAGHGTTTAAPKEWHAGNQSISLIVPYDTDMKLENAAMSKFAIPDRTIGALLHKLAEQQGVGDNITVIFDCCHSGSGTRDIGSSRRPRGFVSHGVPPANLDKDIWNDVPQCRDLNVVKGFAQAGTKSHVLLAACREAESAYENQQRGYFTQALLRALRSVKPDQVTYKELMQRVPNISGQTPQCEGHNVDRVLFNALIPGRRRAVYSLGRLERKRRFVVEAGSIHGVVEGATTFAVYAKPDFKLDDPIVANMKAAKVYAFTTELVHLGPLTSHGQSTLDASLPCFAVQSSMEKAAALHLHIASAGQRPNCIVEALEKVERTHQVSGGPAIIVEDDPTLANLAVQASGDIVTYTIHEPSITSLGLYHLCGPTKADADAIRPVLSAASHFFWHLHHAPKKHELNGKVEIEFTQLKADEEADLGEDLSRPYIAHGPNLYNSGVVEVAADDETPYGILVRNKSLAPLHIWAFYFNCSTLAISDYYRPPAIGSNAEGSLPAGRKVTKDDLNDGEHKEGDILEGELRIGYGAGGGQPYKFFLSEDHDSDSDVGFIKLFISTESVDLSSIEQRSPWDFANARDAKKANPAAAIWDTVTIAVVQQRVS